MIRNPTSLRLSIGFDTNEASGDFYLRGEPSRLSRLRIDF